MLYCPSSSFFLIYVDIMTDTPTLTLLDGAMGTELRHRGVKVPDYKSSIWSALAMIDAPDVIKQIHKDYIAAGSDVITINNYAVTAKLLARENMESRLAELTNKACEIAIAARNESNDPAQEARSIRIAGSLPPLNTSYRYDLVGSYEDNLRAYEEMAALLLPHVDILLCETMSTVDEAKAAATAAALAIERTGDGGRKQIGKKQIWMSWTLRPEGGALRNQQEVAEAIDALSHLPIDAFMFNCCATDPVSSTLPALRKLTEKPIGAYCNPVKSEPSGGEPMIASGTKLDASEYADIALGWVASGVNMIGGCCDTNPEYIAAIKRGITLASSGMDKKA
ncbi:MAG: hypothetical protein GKR95_15650 [Gammaproteobacteria bacterium]|nr:hypothetical protein [Gammaproteobacteria bacterium]